MRLFALVFVSLALVVQPAMANTAPDPLSECLKDNTSGKDRKDLARWIFASMASHPDLRSLTAVADTTRLDANKQMGALVTRLLTVNCAAQTRLALQLSGGQGMATAFKSLGEVAMMELMSNPQVNEAVSAYAEFVDKKKMEEVLRK